MKREGAITLFIHGFPWALSYLFRSLAFAFQLFEMVLCMWFGKYYEKRPCLGNLCNDSCLNVYKDILSFEKCFNCLKWCFVYDFENILKRGLCLGNLCNNSCLNVLQRCLSFEKMFQCLKVCFGKMF